jgi:hypothetical protein
VAQQKTATNKTGHGRTNKSQKKAELNQSKAADESLTIDRRRSQRRAESAESGETKLAAKPKLERRQKVNRRRQIDPTTCERDYTEQEVEFMNALDDYKRKSGRMFPTCSEVLEVIHSLGYVKMSPAAGGAPMTACCGSTSAKPMPSWPVAVADASTHEGGLTMGSIEEHLTY